MMIYVRLALVLLIASVCSLASYKYADHKQQLVIDKMVLDQQKELLDAQQKADQVEREGQLKLAAVTTDYEKRIQDAQDKARSDIAAYATGTQRLRVSLSANACTPSVPSPAASTSSSHDAPQATLSGSTAARLAGRYAEYNAIVAQLGLCQATISDYLSIAGAAKSPKGQ